MQNLFGDVFGSEAQDTRHAVAQDFTSKGWDAAASLCDQVEVIVKTMRRAARFCMRLANLQEEASATLWGEFGDMVQELLVLGVSCPEGLALHNLRDRVDAVISRVQDAAAAAFGLDDRPDETPLPY